MIPLDEIRRAREVLAGKVVRTPLVRLDGTDVYLKLENLQPIGSFKLRGALNAIGGASPEAAPGRAWSRAARATWVRASPGRRASSA